MEINEILQKMYTTLDDRKAKNIQVIDIRGISIMTDYFVVASASNANHIQALVDHMEDEMRSIGLHYTHMEGYKSANWILMDYGDIIVHIFDDASRDFYDIERIWRDGKLMVMPQ